jgi:hypothetical protein
VTVVKEREEELSKKTLKCRRSCVYKKSMMERMDRTRTICMPKKRGDITQI